MGWVKEDYGFWRNGPWQRRSSSWAFHVTRLKPWVAIQMIRFQPGITVEESDHTLACPTRATVWDLALQADGGSRDYPHLVGSERTKRT